MKVKDLYKIDLVKNYLPKLNKNLLDIKINNIIFLNNNIVEYDYSDSIVLIDGLIFSYNIENILIEKLNNSNIIFIFSNSVDKILKKKIHKKIIYVDNKVDFYKLFDELINYKYNQNLNVYYKKETLHRTILRMIMMNASLDELILYLSKYIKRNIILFDIYYNIIGSSIKIDKVYFFEKNIIVNNKKYGNNKYYLHKIFSKNNIFGHLLILDTETLDDELKILMEQFSIMFAIHFFKNSENIEKYRLKVQNIFYDILNNKYDDKKIKKMLSSINWNFYKNQYIIYIELFKNIDLEEILIRINDKLLLKYNNSLELFRIILLNGSIFIFILENDLNDVVKILIEIKNIKYIGISDLLKYVKNYKLHIKQAIDVVEIGKIIRKDINLFFYKDYFFINLFREIKNSNFLDNCIQNNQKMFSEDNIILLETLFYFIKNKFNKINTSKELNLHYNTVSYRINKLYELGILNDDGIKSLEFLILYYYYKCKNI